jgi:hypothetical protein
MTTDPGQGRARRPAPLGVGLIVAVSGLVALSGLYVLAVPVDRGFFEGSTGVAWAELEAAYPAVATHIERSGRVTGMVSVAFALLAFALAWWPLRRGQPWAASLLWLLPLGLLGWSVLFAVHGATMLLVYYGALALAAAGGLVLVSRRAGSD